MNKSLSIRWHTPKRMKAGRRGLLRVLASISARAHGVLGKADPAMTGPVHPFALSDVSLLPGYFKTVQQLNGRYPIRRKAS